MGRSSNYEWGWLVREGAHDMGMQRYIGGVWKLLLAYCQDPVEAFFIVMVKDDLDWCSGCCA